jgi:FOG: FHA domain
MISIRCPHCHVGLKVDESKLPVNINSFPCPKCKKEIPVSLVVKPKTGESDSETILLASHPFVSRIGGLRVVENRLTSAQSISLQEGINIVGRKSDSSDISCPIATEDKQMSRAHIMIEVKKDIKGFYQHYLSDNKSKNRTLYNNNYLEQDEVIVLKNKDEIQIGQTLLIFEE